MSVPSSDPIQTGEVIGPYSVERLLGQGGMASVYRVRHSELGGVYALKVLHQSHPQIRKRLIQEGRMQSSLRHPNVLGVYDVLEHNHCPALVLEYVDGPNLDELLRLRKIRVPLVESLARGVLQGIRAAHRVGLVHRDLKPHNILLSSPGETLIVPKVADFGLAKELGANGQGLTRTGQVFGTPNYMAPEQFRDARNVDGRADIFAFGCILYEMISGKVAFGGDDLFDVHARITQGRYVRIRDLGINVPSNLQDIVDGCLKVEPGDRFSHCDDIFDLLGARAVGPTLGEETWRAVRPRLEENRYDRAGAGATISIDGISGIDAAEIRISREELEQLRASAAGAMPHPSSVDAPEPSSEPDGYSEAQTVVAKPPSPDTPQPLRRSVLPTGFHDLPTVVRPHPVVAHALVPVRLPENGLLRPSEAQRSPRAGLIGGTLVALVLLLFVAGAMGAAVLVGGMSILPGLGVPEDPVATVAVPDPPSDGPPTNDDPSIRDPSGTDGPLSAGNGEKGQGPDVAAPLVEPAGGPAPVPRPKKLPKTTPPPVVEPVPAEVVVPPPPPPPGVLEIHLSSQGWANVWVDGKLLQRTAPVSLRLEPGTHVVRVANEALGIAYEFERTIVSGARDVVTVKVPQRN